MLEIFWISEKKSKLVNSVLYFLVFMKLKSSLSLFPEYFVKFQIYKKTRNCWIILHMHRYLRVCMYVNMYLKTT